MEIIVENRRDPNEFYKFFDVESIRDEYVADENGGCRGFRLRYGDRNKREVCFPEWKYKFYLV